MKKNDISKTWAELKKAKNMAEGLAVASVLINQAAYKTGKFLYGLNMPKAPASKTSSQSSAAHKATGMTRLHAEAADAGVTAETILASAHHESASAAQETMAASGYHTSTDGTGEHHEASAARVKAELIYSDSESEVTTSTGTEIANGPATGTDPSTATPPHLTETGTETIGTGDSITKANMGDAEPGGSTTMSNTGNAGLGANTSPAANSGAAPTTNTGASTEQMNPFSTELWQLDHDLRTLKSEYEKAPSDTEKNVIHFKILRLERKRREYLNRGR